MKLKILKTSLILATLLCVLAPQVSAFEKLDNPLKADSFKEIIDTLINFITILAVAIAPIFIIYAGYLFMTSGGEPTKLKTAKNVITYVVIGLAILFLSKALISVIINVIGVEQTTGQ